MGERGPCAEGPLSPCNVRVDGRDCKAWVPDLKGMAMLSLDVTRRIKVDFVGG